MGDVDEELKKGENVEKDVKGDNVEEKVKSENAERDDEPKKKKRRIVATRKEYLELVEKVLSGYPFKLGVF